MKNCFANKKSILEDQTKFSRSRNCNSTSISRRKQPEYGFKKKLVSCFAFFNQQEQASPLAAQQCSRRICFLIGFFGFFGFGLITRLYFLQQTEYGKWDKLASRQHQSLVEIQGARGNILDANGKSLAVSVKSYSLGLHPNNIINGQEFAETAAHFLGVDEEGVYSKTQEKGKNFVWLARGIPEDMARRVQQLAPRAVSPISEFSRYYPQGALAGSVLGWVGRDGRGLSGIEMNFDNYLKAESSQRVVRRDARGRLMSVDEIKPDSGKFFKSISWRLVSQAEASTIEGSRKEGGDISLTIDADIQAILEEELQRGQVDAKSKRIFGLMLDAETGAILATSQTPAFNPNLKSELTPQSLRNAVIQDSFEPGSTFKPLVAALAIDHGLAFPDEIMNCENGRYKVGPHIIKDVHPVGIVPFPDILIRSSNVCLSKLGQRLGRSKLHDGIARLGFGATSGVELPGEARGILREKESWREIDLATHSFGQGVAVTALQLVRAYTALANGGMLVEPTLLKEKASAAKAKRVLSEETAVRISDMLYGVTESPEGTGKNAKVSGVRVAGKTGTAQKAREDGRGYEASKVLASFIGYVDAREMGLNRKLVMLIAVDEPGVYPRWGGVVAAPVFSRIMQRTLSHLLIVDGKYMQSAKKSGGSAVSIG